MSREILNDPDEPAFPKLTPIEIAQNSESDSAGSEKEIIKSLKHVLMLLNLELDEDKKQIKHLELRVKMQKETMIAIENRLKPDDIAKPIG